MNEVERYDLCEFNNGLVVCKGGFLIRAEEYDEVYERLTTAEQYVQKLIDASENQDSIATGYLSDILNVIKGN